MIVATIIGQVRGTNTERRTSNGAVYAAATLHACDRDGQDVQIHVTAHGLVGENLLRFRHGDTVRVVGEIAPRVRVDRSDNAHVSFDMTARTVEAAEWRAAS